MKSCGETHGGSTLTSSVMACLWERVLTALLRVFPEQRNTALTESFIQQALCLAAVPPIHSFGLSKLPLQMLTDHRTAVFFLYSDNTKRIRGGNFNATQDNIVLFLCHQAKVFFFQRQSTWGFCHSHKKKPAKHVESCFRQFKRPFDMLDNVCVD